MSRVEAPPRPHRRLPHRPTARSVVLGAAVLLTLLRSLVFVCWEGSQFDANQAVIGLMARHIAAGRAFPLFMYGQDYMLGVQAWLAAPLFALFGPSVTALKLPLLGINIAVAWLLVTRLIDDGGLPPWAAGVAAVFFVLAGPGACALLVEASGGTVEPFLYVLLLWALRRRPVWCGLTLGLGLLHREFTVYGFAALAILTVVRGGLRSRRGVRDAALVLAAAGTVYAAAAAVRPYAPAMGPGTTEADLPARAREPVEVADRMCIDWPAVPRGYLDIVRVHWPLLFSTAVRPIRAFDVETDLVQGAPWAGAVLGLAMLLAAVRVIVALARTRSLPPEHDLFAYLVLTGAFSVSAYVVFRCGVIQSIRMRYDLLSLLGAVGLAGWYLRVERSRALTAVWTALILTWAAAVAWPHARLLAEYMDDAPVGGKRAVVAALEARHVRYAIAKYAMAYPVAFLSDERILVSSTNRVRILGYEKAVAAHRGQAIEIRHTPCAGGSEALAGVFFCPP